MSPARYSGAPAQRKTALLDALDEAYRPWASALSTEQTEALCAYTMISYTTVNGLLRGRAEWLLDDKASRVLARRRVHHIDTALAVVRTPFALRVFRGWKDPCLADPEALVGETIADLGYLSLTLDVAVARKFTRPYHDWDYWEGEGAPAVLLAVELPAGAPAAYLPVARVDRNLSEREILLARGSTLQVIACTRRGNGLPVLACHYADTAAVRAAA